jgi:hypothetical protein
MSGSRRRERIAENVDILIGFLGFFVVLLVVVIITMEVNGQNAAMWSVGLLGVVLAIWGLLKVRRRNGGDPGL